MADRDRTYVEIMKLVEEFRKRGAISPDRAMTTSDLGSRCGLKRQCAVV